MTDNMNPGTDRAAMIDDIIDQWMDVLTSDDLEDLAAEALRKRYDKWNDSELIEEYLGMVAGRIPNPTL
jgi:lysyl-tRNA synthetase class I